MRPFITIATPHEDILKGRLTMDIFAADLWQVHTGKAPEEYKNPQVFFRKTYPTAGLRNLLEIARRRLRGEVGDPIIQLQTPFGGGKTHSLIALYHKAKEWNAKVVVLDGTVFDPRDRSLWEEIEFQLTGRVELLQGKVSPGREKLHKVLSENQPLLILIDELLEYITKASGVKVGDSNLAGQSLAFIHELTTTIRTLDKVLLVFTLPSSILERYDQNAESFLQQIQHITGRVEKVYTPVEDEEVARVIVKRLFSHVDRDKARDNVDEFISYAEREGIFSPEMDKSYYREKFINSFPFQPEVIDVLYKRWGSFPNFQRTRGVLRTLALVVHSLKDSQKPFIRLGDIDLKNQEIRRELIRHIGNEYDSILALDITEQDAGAKRVDRSLASVYQPFSFGTRCATAIFMYSFSAGSERGTTLQELKLSCAEVYHSSSIIAEAVEKLRQKLFYLSDSGLFFTNQPNLNRILLNKLDQVDDRYLEVEEEEMLNKYVKKESKFNVILWPNKTKDVPDTRDLKLIFLRKFSEDKIKEFLEYCGERPRVYRNTLIFLCPFDVDRVNFDRFIREKLAWRLIEKDISLNLTEEQKRKVRENIKIFEEDSRARLRDFYRIVVVPIGEGLKDIDLGIGMYSTDISLDQEVYKKLKDDGDIVDSINPLVIESKYLRGDYVSVRSIYDVFYTCTGEPRILSEEVLKRAIRDGVKMGLFGIGKLEENKPVCKCFKEDCTVELSEEEILIKPALCKEKAQKEEGEVSKEEGVYSTSSKSTSHIESTVQSYTTSTIQREEYVGFFLRVPVPFGRLSDMYNLLRNLNLNFTNLRVVIEVDARGGKISKEDYENKVEEALKQMGIDMNEVQIKPIKPTDN